MPGSPYYATTATCIRVYKVKRLISEFPFLLEDRMNRRTVPVGHSRSPLLPIHRCFRTMYIRYKNNLHEYYPEMAINHKEGMLASTLFLPPYYCCLTNSLKYFAVPDDI